MKSIDKEFIYKQTNVKKVLLIPKGGTRQSFLRGGSVSEVKPLRTRSLISFFDREGTSFAIIPSIDIWYPFRIPSLELCVTFTAVKALSLKHMNKS